MGKNMNEAKYEIADKCYTCYKNEELRFLIHEVLGHAECHRLIVV